MSDLAAQPAVDRFGHEGGRAAFTLLELLVVLAVVSVLIGMMLPAMGSLQGASQLRRAGEMVSNAVALARQTALTRNRSVAFRFYARSQSEPFFACQYFILEDSGELVPGKFYRLPDNMVVSRNDQHTKLPDIAPAATATLPGNEAAVYSEFRFRRDGSTDLDAGEKWFVTAVNARDVTTALPANFQSLLIDPANGTVRTFQP